MKDKHRAQAEHIVREVFKKYPCGGALHIVIGDGNVDDRNILWCLQNSVMEDEYKADRALFEDCAVSLLKLQTEQKRMNCIYNAFHGKEG